MVKRAVIAHAYPAKRFFVDMLVRDIALQDAILDLLDNCVDGAMRSLASAPAADVERPYNGFAAYIAFDGDSFSISDNCGGISLALAKDYAFRMGREEERDKDLPTVGVYGIGMKRAVFKLGRHTVVRSRTEKEGFELTIAPDWLENDNNWDLPLVVNKNSLPGVGTQIVVSQLREGIPRLFSDETGFVRTLSNAISAYYGYIIDKGFSVYVNKQKISPVKLSFVADDFTAKEAITPYIYEAEIDGVEVSMTIGLYRQLPTDEEDDESLLGKHSSEKAGITVVCNDRVVLYADKSRVTGWGEATVPSYHTQFTSIAGTVIFKSNDARKLPLTTTKRGVDGNSELYLGVKEFMREGLKLFTDFTNKWKKSSRELGEINSRLTATVPEVMLSKVPQDKWIRVQRAGVGGQRYRPNLPLPREDDPHRQIKFSRRASEIAEVAVFLFDDATVAAMDVGAKCFDDVLKKARK